MKFKFQHEFYEEKNGLGHGLLIRDKRDNSFQLVYNL